MPTVVLLGQPCRVRPMLDAIGAQESLEHFGTTRPHAMHGPSRARAWEKQRLGYAARRNAAERKLRPAEAAAWQHWRSADYAGRRLAIRAMLDDLARGGRYHCRPTSE